MKSLDWIKKEIKPGNLIFGLQTVREPMLRTLKAIYDEKPDSTEDQDQFLPVFEKEDDNPLGWTIDIINNSFSCLSVQNQRLMEPSEKALNKLKPDSRKKFVRGFLAFLNTKFPKELGEVFELCKVAQDESALIRFSCQKAISYVLDKSQASSRSNEKIVFILDDIDIRKAMNNVKNECYTTSEIRECFRVLTGPDKENLNQEGLKFYKNGEIISHEAFIEDCESKLGKASLLDSPRKKTITKEGKEKRTPKRELPEELLGLFSDDSSSFTLKKLCPNESSEGCESGMLMFSKETPREPFAMLSLPVSQSPWSQSLPSTPPSSNRKLFNNF